MEIRNQFTDLKKLLILQLYNNLSGKLFFIKISQLC